jgi:hypothetical protein
MICDLEFELCDTSAEEAPRGWSDGIHNAGLHQAWNWSIVRARSLGRGRMLAGTFRDGDRVIGLGAARLHGLGRLPGVVDVDCPGTSSLPGIALPGAVPATLHPDGTDPDLLAAALHAFESALRRECGRWLQAIVYRQVYRAELPVVLLGATTVAREGAPIAVLRSGFADHDAYLRTLRKSRRVDQRRLVRLIDADPETSVWLGPAPAANLDVDTMFRLSLATARRNHHQRWPPLRYWRREMFAAVLALPHVDVIQYTDPQGGLIAASLMFDHPTAPVLGPWGARPLGPDRRSGLWFDHLDRLIRRAVEAGRPLVIGGKGQADMKASLGFVPYQQWSVLRRMGR